MENDKARFFSLYWGQNIFQHNGSDLPLQKVGVTYMDGYGIKNRHLLLKPLSEISDEDCEYLMNLFEGEEVVHGTGYVTLNKQSDVRLWHDGEILKRSDIDQNPLQILEAYDFLRSKSYLLPFGKYTTDQLISMGWAKIK